MSYFLGITAFHPDSSASLVKDGKILSFVEEERFSRVKHHCGFPIKSINFCLNENNIFFNDITSFAINGNKFSSLKEKIFYSIFNFNPNFYINKLISKNSNTNKFNQKLPSNIKKLYLDHHLCHVASSCYLSDYSDSNFLSVDGFGDFKSSIYGYYKNDKIYQKGKINFPNSLGIFYHAMTQFVGFNSVGDEYKVMGLSAFGSNEFEKKLDQIISFNNNQYFLDMSYFNFQKKELLNVDENGYPKFGNIFNEKINDLFGFKQRNKNHKLEEKYINLAYSTQKVFEKIFFKYLNFTYKDRKSDNIILSGGCALNSLATGKITENTNYKNVYICPYPGDQGGAIGAALLANSQHSNINFKKYSNLNSNPFMGPKYSDEEILMILDNYKKNKIKFESLNEDDLIEKITDLLINKNIIGWFQGRMEAGARALGNRSLIADPRHSDMKDLINKKIKLREEFRPFAPSVLKKFVKEWFETNDDEIPYMNKVYRIKKDKSVLVPAVVHKDGTCRLQTVDKNLNELYYKLISNFYEKTKVPMILNTSLNENEPIVNTPIEAIDMFLRTDMDYLILNNFLINKTN